jgi:ADP-heptose:LPS heptosyltransferase
MSPPADGNALLDVPRRIKRGLMSPRLSARLARLLARHPRPETKSLSLGAAKRVLVLKLDLVGDVVCTTPFFRELRKNCPNARITAVVRPAAKELLELSPHIDEFLTFQPSRSARLGGFVAFAHAVRFAVTHLLPRKFDLAILPRWEADNYYATFMLAFSGAKWRVSFSESANEEKARLNRGYDQLLTHAFATSEVKHEVPRNLEIVERLGGRIEDDRLELRLSAADEAEADRLLGWSAHRTGAPLVALVPGGTEKRRQWPVERYAELANWLVSELAARVVIVGGPSDLPIAREIEGLAQSPVLNLVNHQSLRLAAAMLRRCSLCVANDTGPKHLAAAVGVPVVQISCHSKSSSTAYWLSPARFGPWGVPTRVVQPETPTPPCIDECLAPTPHCVAEISFETVQRAVLASIQSLPHAVERV